MEGAAVNSMETLLTTGTSVLTWVLTSIGSILDVVMEEPILLISVILMLVGVCFGYIKRAIGTV